MNRIDPLQNQAKRLFRGGTAIPWGVDLLDDAFIGIPQTDLNIIGAASGVGKTEIATKIALNASRKGHNVLFLALEAEDGEIEDRIVWGAISREWWRENPHGKPGVTMRYADWRMGLLEDELFHVEQALAPQINSSIMGLRTVYRDKGKDFTVTKFLDLIDACDDYHLIIVDHLHYFDLEDQNESVGIKNAIKRIRDRALLKQKPVILLSHLRKLNQRVGAATGGLPDIDDFHGHSDITKVGINVILMARAQFDSHPSKIPNWIYIPKSRHAGDTTSYAGLVNYDIRTGTFAPGYVLHKVDRWTEPQEVPVERLPKWAKRAVPLSNVQAPPSNRVI